MKNSSNSRSESTEIFEKMPIAKAVSVMAIPTVISQLIVLIYNMADTFFLGKTNNPSMVAAVSLILPVFNISLSFSGLAGIGGGALVSRLLGSKDTDEAKKVSGFSIYLSVIIALAFSAIMFVFMHPIMNILGASKDTYDYAKAYSICVIVLGGVPTVLSNTLSSLIRSIGLSKQAGFGITMGGIINMILDPLFMFVIFPKGSEIVGAGIATLLSNCIACAYFIVIICRMESDSVLKLCPISLLPTVDSIKSIMVVGIPSAIATLLFDLDYVVLDKLMSAYGDQALAAIGIVLKVERLPLNVGIGICQGMIPIVAYNYSAKNYTRMRDTKNFSLKAGLCCALISIVLYELFASQIMRIFIADAQTVTLGTDFLRVRILATPLMFLSFFHVHFFNGLGAGKEALFLGVARWLGLNIPMLFILNYFIGIYGLVWSQISADVFTVTLSIFVYERYVRRNGLKCN